MTRHVLWDSSAILALLDADDADHATAVIVVRRLAAERRPSFITNYVEVETHALLRRLGRAIAREWLLSARLPIVRVSAAEEGRARELLVRRPDKAWSLCDAISFCGDRGEVCANRVLVRPSLPAVRPGRGVGCIGRRLSASWHVRAPGQGG